MLASFLLLLSSCGPKSGQFRIEGRFRNLNNGEFYIYSTDGSLKDMDTIKVADGRFSYETALQDEGTFILLFPNLSEQAIFGQSGATAKIEGDASHLKEMEVTGTDDNKLYTQFRKRANRLTPPEVAQAASEFVKDNPQSPVSLYLVRRYFLQTDRPDYSEASRLLGLMQKADPQNGLAITLKKQVDRLCAAAVNSSLPAFSAVDTKGNAVGSANLKAKANIINVWASWNYESNNLQVEIKQLKKKYGADLSVMSICLDASLADCKNNMTRDSITWPNICDGKMWQSPLAAQLGLAAVPGNIVIDRNGKVVARNLNSQRLSEQVERLLK